MSNMDPALKREWHRRLAKALGVNPALRWECEDPNCDHVSHMWPSVWTESGYLPLSLQLEVLVKTTFESLADHEKTLSKWILYDDWDTAVSKPYPHTMYHCIVCHVMVDMKFATAIRHCDTLEHRTKISSMVENQNDTLPPKVFPGDNAEYTDEEATFMDDLNKQFPYKPSSSTPPQIPFDVEEFTRAIAEAEAQHNDELWRAFFEEYLDTDDDPESIARRDLVAQLLA